MGYEFTEKYRLKLIYRLYEIANSKSLEECWPWPWHRDRQGYGKFRIERFSERAHRAAWALLNGPIKQGLCICHKCDNPSCVNPSHLFIGSVSDNNRDAIRKGRFNNSLLFKGGENNPKAKLSWDNIEQIRKKYADGGTSQRKLSAKYGVGKSQVGRILRYERWGGR